MIKNGTYKLSTEKRVSTLEANYVNLEKKVDEIREWQTNHFEQFKDDFIDKLDILDSKLCKKIEDISKGIPAWMTVIIVIFTGLVTYFLTH